MAGMNPELMFHTEDEVMFYDTDCGGVVHNLVYLRMIENGLQNHERFAAVCRSGAP